jgi:hypothetical protein
MNVGDHMADTQIILIRPREPLLVRVLFALFGFGALLLALDFAGIGLFGINLLGGTVQGSWVVGFVGCFCFGLFFLAVWFHESRFLYDRDTNEIIGMSRLFCVWWHHRYPLAGVSHLSTEYRRGWLTGGSHWLWLVFPDGRREILMQASSPETAPRLSRITGLRLEQDESVVSRGR